MAEVFMGLPHVYEYNPRYPNYEAFDFGFGVWTCIDVQIIPHTRMVDGVPVDCPVGGRWFLWREYYLGGKTVNAHIINLKGRPNPEGFSVTMGFGDPAAPGDMEELAKYWCPMQMDTKLNAEAKQDFRRGVAEVQKLLTPALCEGPHLLVDPGCVHFVREISNYKERKPQRQGDRTSEGKPPKRDDHLLDPLRYMVMHIQVLGGGFHLSDLANYMPEHVERQQPEPMGRVEESNTFFGESVFAGERF